MRASCAQRTASKVGLTPVDLTIHLAWYPYLSSSKHHAVCTEKFGLDLIELLWCTWLAEQVIILPSKFREARHKMHDVYRIVRAIDGSALCR